MGIFHPTEKIKKKHWLMQTLNHRVQTTFFNNEKIRIELKNQVRLLENNQTTVLAATEIIINTGKVV